MNIAYFRKSTFGKDETIANVKKAAAANGLSVLGETTLPSGNGTILHVCNPTWIGNVIAADKNLLGLLPCSIAVLSKGDDVLVGAGSPSVLGSVSQSPAIAQVAQSAEDTVKTVIHAAAGVGALKPIKIKLYSTTTCPYCKMEAAWLTEKKVAYEEVHVDQNQQEAEKMVEKTGQMGVPVTAIEYEGGEEEFIVGFNKPQLSKILEVNQ